MVDVMSTANAQSSLKTSHTDRTHDLHRNDALNSGDDAVLDEEASETAPPKFTVEPDRTQAQPPKHSHGAQQRVPLAGIIRPAGTKHPVYQIQHPTNFQASPVIAIPNQPMSLDLHVPPNLLSSSLTHFNEALLPTQGNEDARAGSAEQKPSEEKDPDLRAGMAELHIDTANPSMGSRVESDKGQDSPKSPYEPFAPVVSLHADLRKMSTRIQGDADEESSYPASSLDSLGAPERRRSPEETLRRRVKGDQGRSHVVH